MVVDAGSAWQVLALSCQKTFPMVIISREKLKQREKSNDAKGIYDFFLIDLTVLGLSCSTWDLQSSFGIWDFFLVEVYKLLVAAYELLAPPPQNEPLPIPLGDPLTHGRNRAEHPLCVVG